MGREERDDDDKKQNSRCNLCTYIGIVSIVRRISSSASSRLLVPLLIGTLYLAALINVETKFIW